MAADKLTAKVAAAKAAAAKATTVIPKASLAAASGPHDYGWVLIAIICVIAYITLIVIGAAHDREESAQNQRPPEIAPPIIPAEATPEHIERERLKVARGSYGREEAMRLLKRQYHKCNNPYCRTDLFAHNMHLDHIQPLSRWGTSEMSNLQWLCQPCNNRKGKRSWGEFMATQG